MSDSAGRSDTSDTFIDVADGSVGVGLSDPKYASWRRKMLDVANKLHNTGYVLDHSPDIVRPMLINAKGSVLHGPTNDHSDRVAECGEVLVDRVFLGCDFAESKWHLHQVRIDTTSEGQTT